MISEKLAAAGIALPEPVAPVANYMPFVVAQNMITVSGQISIRDGSLISGRVGDDLDVEAGAAAARQCGVNILAQMNAACHSVGKSLDDIRQIIRLGGFVTSTPQFTDQPKVINGASDLMVEIFGDKGRHARFAVGVAALPLGAAVEIDAVAELG